MYDSTKVELIPVSALADQWRGGQVPPNRPQCGYVGDRCVPVTTSGGAVSIAVTFAVLLISAVSALILW